MFWIDTHNHIYLPEFDHDRSQVIERSIEAGVKLLLMPNVDSATHGPLMEAASYYPGICLPMMALHPTSVKQGFEAELQNVEQSLKENKFVAVGETGLDLYWDKTFFKEQVFALKRHAELALEHNLPLVIHSRNALNEIFEALDDFRNSGLRGVFHCFPGDVTQAAKVIGLGFFIGVGGVVTYKNGGLAKVVEYVGLDHIILETDAPYLAPLPHRGKRNEPSFIKLIGQKVASITGASLAQTASITTRNSMQLFGITTTDKLN
ncbi:MAG TPA: TatD family hydrolase [Bacteroidales bacterium]|nr:TatD family hydrolase [Bacteroidales bacterium]